MSKLQVALFWNALQAFGQLAINLLSLFILARILTPEDYGAYGILMIFISLSEQITDCGIGGYLIKKKDISEIYYDTLFIFNMGVSVILYGIMFLSAPYIATFYNDPNIIAAIRILGLVIIVNAFSITQRTRLLKNLQFKAMALIFLFAGIIGFAVAYILAQCNYSYWALIWQNIVFCSLSTLLCVLVNRKIPRFRFRFSVFKEQFAFGINLFASSALLTITNNISNNVIAKIFSIRTTGLYSQANRMQSYPLSVVSLIIDRTFFPILSKQNDDIPRLRSNANKMRRTLYAYLMPAFSILICFADEIIRFVLGEQWSESTPIFQILMIASYFTLAKSMNRSVLKSLGYTFSILKFELCSTLVLSVILALSAILHNMLVLIFAVVMSQFASALCSMVYLKLNAGFSLRKQLVDFLTFAAIASVPCIVLLFNTTLGHKILITLISMLILVFLCSRLLNIAEYKRLFDWVNTLKGKIAG